MNLGSGEIVVILLVALIVLGPTRLPEAARQVGKAMRTIRQVSTGFQDEVRHAIADAEEEAAATAAGVEYTPPPKPNAPMTAHRPSSDRPADPGTEPVGSDDTEERAAEAEAAAEPGEPDGPPAAAPAPDPADAGTEEPDTTTSRGERAD